MVEYTYNSTELPLNEYGFIRINNHSNGEINYFSHPVNREDYLKVYRETNNVFDNTAIRTNNIKSNGDIGLFEEYVHLDIDQSNPIQFYENIEPSWVFDDINNIIDAKKSNIIVEYDSIKIHILRGYNFDGENGFVLKTSYYDQRQKFSINLTNNVYTKQDVLKFHSKPLRIADRLYDRYYEIKFPKLKSLKYIHETSNAKLKLHYDSIGVDSSNILQDFKLSDSDTTISISILTINNIRYDESNRKLLDLLMNSIESDNSIAQISLIDQFESLVAVLKESYTGDYFEYYAGFNDGFIYDWISSNPIYAGSEFVLYHTVAVFEHFRAGLYNERVSQIFTVEQTDNFDEPLFFRPVIMDERTTHFTIEYYLRVVDINAICPSQIIRKASLTFPNAKRYGRVLESININPNLSNFKIINKLIPKENINTAMYNSSNFEQIKNNAFSSMNVLSSNFLLPVNTNAINITQNNLGFDENGKLSQATSSKLAYGQNKLTLNLTPFDNYLMFEIFTLDNNNFFRYNTNRSPEFEYHISFVKTDGSKYKIKAKDINENILFIGDGKLVFLVSAEDVSIITGDTFWITMTNNIIKNIGDTKQYLKNFETVIYTGQLVIQGRGE